MATTIEAQVKSLVAKQLSTPVEKISTSTNFRDLGFTNSDIYLDFILVLEKEFNIKISDKTAASFKTVNDVIAYLKLQGVSTR